MRIRQEELDRRETVERLAPQLDGFGQAALIDMAIEARTAAAQQIACLRDGQLSDVGLGLWHGSRPFGRGVASVPKRLPDAHGEGIDPESEWQVLGWTLDQLESTPKDRSRGGRPAMRAVRSDVIELANAISIYKVVDSSGHATHFRGRNVDSELVDTVMLEIQRLLEPLD